MKIKTLVTVLTIFFLHGSEKSSPGESSSNRLKTEAQTPSIEEQLKGLKLEEMRFSYPIDIYRFSMNKGYSPIKTMPPEVAVRMAQFLPPKDLAHLAKTSIPMRDVAKLAMTKLEFNNKPIDQINAALDRYAGPQLKTLIIENSDAQKLHWDKIAQCINLQTLFLVNCKLIWSALPQELTALTKLHYLSFAQNNLSAVDNWDILPKSLKGLYVWRCQLTLNELPLRISQLSQLQELDFSNDDLSHVLNWDILPISLKNINLSDCGLTLNQLPEKIIELTQLQQLDLSMNNLSQVQNWNVLPAFLQVLSLDNGQLTLNELPEKIAQLTQLKILTFAQNNLSNVQNWNILPLSLEELYLQQCQLILNELPPRISQLTQLKTLSLFLNNLEQVHNWAILNNLPQFQDLYIQQSGVNHRPNIRQSINVRLQ